MDAKTSPSRAIRRPTVQALTGLSRTTLYTLERAGSFPRHWMLTPRCAVWDEAEVLAWVSARRAAAVRPAPVPRRFINGVPA